MKTVLLSTVFASLAFLSVEASQTKKFVTDCVPLKVGEGISGCQVPGPTYYFIPSGTVNVVPGPSEKTPAQLLRTVRHTPTGDQ